MLPAARLSVDIFDRQADDIDEQAFGDAVLAHDPGGVLAPSRSELEVAITLDREQAVTLHARDRLRDRGAALAQTLRDAGAQGHDALLLEFEDRPEVHLRGVDEVAHVQHSTPFIGPPPPRAPGSSSP